MKSEKIILCVAIALTAFGASLGLLELGGYFRTMFEPLKVEIKPLKPVQPPVFSPPIPDFKQPIYSPDKEAPPEESTPEEVVPEEEDGIYYLIDDDPKGFEDFEFLRIDTVKYDEKLEKLVSIKPTGKIDAGKEYKFSWLNVADRRISLITKSRRGVSYQFDGKFTGGIETKYKGPEGEELTDHVFLTGRLTKWRNGKKIAEAKVRFGMSHGC
jgi:hypothetical protein